MVQRGMCRICGNESQNETFTAREMMYGSREPFDYLRCSECGCVQIADAPKDMSRYYPPDYYSFATAVESGRLARFLQRRRALHVLGSRNLVGWLFAGARGLPPTLDYARRAGVGFTDAVLEIGCGNGERLLAMRDYGFVDLSGLDPYVGDTARELPGVKIVTTSLSAHEGAYDFIMLHHTFEHMDDPWAVLERISSMLGRGGKVLLRLPLAASYAFEVYGGDWVQLDAPRHLYLHTPASIGILAARSGFDVTETVYDSTAFQFWGSEQYRRDIPLRDERSYAVNRDASIFSRAEIDRFEAHARRLNREGRGDQACFFLEKTAG